MPWNCEFCGESFENQEALSRHLRRKHRSKVKLAILEHPLSPKPKRKPEESNS
ncbi:MAG: C2H2-type zinc finger protein [Thermoproteota archaeon]